MATGITVNNVDLDSIFKARQTAKRADVGFIVNGVDISNRYEAANDPEKQITFDTNFKSESTDLRYLFMSSDYVNAGVINTGLRLFGRGTQIYFALQAYNSVTPTNKYSINVTYGGVNTNVTFTGQTLANFTTLFTRENNITLNTISLLDNNDNITKTWNIRKSYIASVFNSYWSKSVVSNFTITDLSQEVTPYATYTQLTNTGGLGFPYAETTFTLSLD